MTLKQGVQNLLCHYLPEVKEVVASLIMQKIFKNKKKYKVLKTLDDNNLGFYCKNYF